MKQYIVNAFTISGLTLPLPLGMGSVKAYQASQRGGTLYCRMADGRVTLAGKTVLFAEAEVYVDAPPAVIPPANTAIQSC